MSNRKAKAFRGVRKSAHISRRIFSKAANLSGKIELKAGRIINGTDPAIKIYNKVLFEEVYADAIPEIIPIHPALPVPGRAAAVTLLLPSLQKSSFFGGTATALIFAAMLAQEKSMPLRIVETLVHGNARASEISDFLKSSGLKVEATSITIVNLTGRKYNHYGYLDMHPKDTFIASAWWDAYLLNKLPLLSKFIYLIQDFEPIFYNNSDKYILADGTYHYDSFIPVCNTELMYNFMKQKGYKYIASEGLFFEPASGVGKKYGYSLLKEKREKRRIFLYGRPAVHRNLFYTAVESINQAFSTYQLDSSEWEIFMAGQDNIPDILLDTGITAKNLGKLSLEEYYEFARTIDVAVSLMLAPHPSYPPLELASIGATVVTTEYENKTNLDQYSKNIIIANPTQSAITEALVAAAAISYDDRIRNAKIDSIETDWAVAFESIIKKLTR